jgi:hypothetical protein
MRPVAVMGMPAPINEIEIQQIDVRQYACQYAGEEQPSRADFFYEI